MVDRTLLWAGVLAAAIVSGCVYPAASAPGRLCAGALEQLGVANAAKDALKAPALDALKGKAVWVEMAGQPAHGVVPAAPAQELLKGMVVEMLVEIGCRVAEKKDAQVVLCVMVLAAGTDSTHRFFLHPLLPIAYHCRHDARVKLHLFAYEAGDSLPLAVADCEGACAWSEWSVLGLGPYR